MKLQDLRGEGNLITLTLKLNPEMKAAWDRIKNISAHSTRGQDLEILSLLMNEWLKKNDMDEKVKRAETKNQSKAQSRKNPESVSLRPNEVSSLKNVALHQKSSGKGRFIPVEVKRTVWKRDQGKCTNCGSCFALQFDHKRPFAKDGDHSTENLRLRCRSCNLHAGIQAFGEEKMKRNALFKAEIQA